MRSSALWLAMACVPLLLALAIIFAALAYPQPPPPAPAPPPAQPGFCPYPLPGRGYCGDFAADGSHTRCDLTVIIGWVQPNCYRVGPPVLR